MAEAVGVAASALAYSGAVPCGAVLSLLLCAFAGPQAARAAFAFRFALAALILLHEWAHIACGLAVGVPSLLTRENAGCGLDAAAWLTMLTPWSAAAYSPAVSPARPASPRQQALVALAGFLTSAVALAILLLRSSSLALVAAAAVVLLSSANSDLPHARSKAPSLAPFRCGNFGLLLEAGRREECVETLSFMAQATATRGSQSGGVVALGGAARPLRVRVCPRRREAVARSLEGALRWWLAWARAGSPRRLPPAPLLYLGHTRFATSSLPSVRESHPHCWPPARVAGPVWSLGPDGCLSREQAPPPRLYVTHNGDFDSLTWGARSWAQRDVSLWLTRVLGSPPPAAADSASVAGVLSLFRTQGLWSASLRLALQECLPASSGFTAAFDYALPAPAAPSAAPSPALLARLAAVADAAFAALSQQRGLLADASADSFAHLLAPHESAIAAWLAEALGDEEALLASVPACHGLPRRSHLVAVCSAAARAFVYNDLQAAVTRFLAQAQGSFGLCVSSSIDPGRIVVGAHSQPMALALAPRAALFASEASALRAPLPAGDAAGWRLDLDSVRGEVCELSFAPPPDAAAGAPQPSPARALDAPASFVRAGDAMSALAPPPAVWPLPGSALRLRLARLPRPEGEAAPAAELEPAAALDLQPRLVPLGGAAEAAEAEARARTRAPAGPGRRDEVLDDLRDTARVLAALRAGWAEGPNGAAADALFELLRARAAEAAAAEEGLPGSGRLAIDVLVTGVESSLWVAEQFAADLQLLFPHLRVLALSANKVIGVLGNARGSISFSGFAFCRMTAKLGGTLCLALSHSGQTFPSLHATAILQRACPGRVFVVTGFADSKMGEAVGQSAAPGAPQLRRVFSTGAGWRPAEPATVSALAMHHLLTELLLHLIRRFATLPAPGLNTPLGLRLEREDVEDLQRVCARFVAAAVPGLTGVDAEGRAAGGAARAALLRQGRAWGWNVLEAPVAWIASATYILLSVLFGVPLFRSLLNLALQSQLAGGRFAYDLLKPDFTNPQWGGARAAPTALYYVAGFLDALLYIFLPTLTVLGLRAAQGRPLLARVRGRRTLVLADVPYVHQLLEVYVSKLFSLSYAIAGLDVHGANPTDHFVHRFTHRVARGVMLAFGRPDGRMASQTKPESWTLMALLQARTIASFGCGPEVLSLGHNPYRSAMMDEAIVLPTHRPPLLCETLLRVAEHEPQARLADMRATLSSGAFSERLRGAEAPIGAHLRDAVASEEEWEEIRQHMSYLAAESARAEEGTVHGGVGPDQDGPGPAARDALLTPECVKAEVLEMLESQASVEEFIENRFLSAERYLAFLVLFHAMAATVAGSLPPLRWDTSRSQSQLRVATTAAPVSAADLVRTWQAGREAGLDDCSFHGGTVSGVEPEPSSPTRGMCMI